jgi:hypothetical protein
MHYNVTAKRDIRLLARIRFERLVEGEGYQAMRPAERKEWIALRAGETRKGLGMPVGLDPECVPPEHRPGLGGPPSVQIDIPQAPGEVLDVWGLLLIECVE